MGTDWMVMTTHCTDADHASLKSSTRFCAETYSIGFMGDEVEMFELRNCNRCHSTLVAAEVIS